MEGGEADGGGQNPSVVVGEEEGPTRGTMDQRQTECELREGGDAGQRNKVVAARHAVRGGEKAGAAR